MLAARPSFLPTVPRRGKIGRANNSSYSNYKLEQPAAATAVFSTHNKGLNHHHYKHLAAHQQHQDSNTNCSSIAWNGAEEIRTAAGKVSYGQWVCLSPGEDCNNCSNCRVKAVIAAQPGAYGLKGSAFSVLPKQETLHTLHLRTGDCVDVLREMNGIPMDFDEHRPLVELPKEWCTTMAVRWRLSPVHELATAIAGKRRLLAVSRTPAFGHADGPSNPYPHAVIKSPSLMLMTQVAFMHLAKNVTWRYISQLFLKLWELDVREGLVTQGLAQPADSDLPGLESARAQLDSADGADDGIQVLFAPESVEAVLDNKPRCTIFVNGTVQAGNTMIVETGKGVDKFDQLKGNKDFRPVFKLLQGRSRLLAAFDAVTAPVRPALAAEKRKWEACGSVLEEFISVVWLQKSSCIDDRWRAIGLAREFVWRFYQVAPVERFSNYIHVMQQWSLLQPDPRKTGVLDGSVKHVPPSLDILHRPDVKKVSDEHGERMRRHLLGLHHNQGGGKVLPAPNTTERGGQTVVRDELGLLRICETCSVSDMEAACPTLPTRPKQRHDHYKTAIAPFGAAEGERWTILEVLEFHQKSGLVYVKDGTDMYMVAAAALDTGLSEEQVMDWIRAQAHPREYVRHPTILPAAPIAVVNQRQVTAQLKEDAANAKKARRARVNKKGPAQPQAQGQAQSGQQQAAPASQVSTDGKCRKRAADPEWVPDEPPKQRAAMRRQQQQQQQQQQQPSSLGTAGAGRGRGAGRARGGSTSRLVAGRGRGRGRKVPLNVMVHKPMGGAS